MQYSIYDKEINEFQTSYSLAEIKCFVTNVFKNEEDRASFYEIEDEDGNKYDCFDIAKKYNLLEKKDVYFEATVDGEGVSLYTTKKNEIMVEACHDDCSISKGDVLDAVGAKGFNICFQTTNKRKFAENCNFENILISKREINDDSNNEVICEYYLAELRADEDKLKELLNE